MITNFIKSIIPGATKLMKASGTITKYQRRNQLITAPIYLDVNKNSELTTISVYSDFEETITLPFNEQETTMDKIVAESIARGAGLKEKRDWEKEFKKARNYYSKLVLSGKADKNDFLDYWGVFKGFLKEEHFKALCETWSINPNYITAITKLKSAAGAENVLINIVARGFTQPFALFFQRPDIAEEFSRIGVNTRLINIKANTLIMKNGIFTGRIKSPIIINKTSHIDKKKIYFGDSRDIQYKMPYFVNVNSGDLDAQINKILEDQSKTF